MPTLRSKTLKLAAELPEGDPTRRKLLAALKVARGDVRMTVTWTQSDYDNTGDSGGNLVTGTYQSIREAMDAVIAATPEMERKEWEVTRKGLEGGIDLANGYVDYNVTLTYKGKAFPKNALVKALLYLQTGREDMSPTVLGDTLSIPGSRGVITITPGNSKAWFQWTVARDGKETSVSRGSTDDGVAEDAIRRGLDPTKVEEANGIGHVLRRETGLDRSQLEKVWWAIYRGKVRGLKMGSLKVALDHQASP